MLKKYNKILDKKYEPNNEYFNKIKEKYKDKFNDTPNPLQKFE